MSMILFTCALEPLLRMLTLSLCNNRQMVTVLPVYAYADDVIILCKETTDPTRIQEVLQVFGNASNSVINFTESTFMALTPRGQTISSRFTNVNKMKILGILFTPNIMDVIETNWKDIVNKIRYGIKRHLSRNLNVIKKVWHINTFILSKIWYLAQVLPIPIHTAQQIEKVVGFYLWKGFVFRIARLQCRLSTKEGGLQLINVKTKCDALFIKEIIRTDHNIDTLVRISNYVASVQASSMTRSLTKLTTDANKFLEAIDIAPEQITTKLIYSYFQDQVRCLPSVQCKFPNKNWKKIWSYFKIPHIPSSWKWETYALINGIIMTEERKYMYHIVPTPQCNKCGTIDTISHRLTRCSDLTRGIWLCVKQQLNNVHKATNPNINLRIVFDLDVPQTPHYFSILWLAMGFIYYMLKNKTKTLPDFIKELRRVYLQTDVHVREKLQTLDFLTEQ
ncbi:hypothetical protein ANN_19415 [Periplaneta americana]|uniref:Reverse transcriptase domain-containing protein n=1 Tax=Periplaneta americana TaxID=6978 RepID=A0ABQ8S9V8_PERAM|nr:hypothetical protein ANN_19415 [Periplaneta americana]